MNGSTNNSKNSRGGSSRGGSSRGGSVNVYCGEYEVDGWEIKEEETGKVRGMNLDD
jgi:hypothetical protein